LICIWNCDYDNKIAINTKQRKISQILQNKMCSPLLHYTNKNEKQGHDVVAKKKKNITSFQLEKRKKISKDAWNKIFKNKKSKRLYP